MDIKQTLLEFSGAAGDVAGMAKHAAGLLAAFGKTSRTPLGSVVCEVRAAVPGQPHLLLDAHLDCVGLIVTHIDDSGFLRVSGCGGVDPRVLPGCVVSIHGGKGRIYGVVCSVPPHLAGNGEKKLDKVDETRIDIGRTKKEAERVAAPGDRISFYRPARALLGDRVCGPALDNLVGCVCLLRALELLEGVELSFGLSVLFSSMEEIGGQGAKTAAYALRPTHALVVDTTFAHTPDSARQKCGSLGDGPMIGAAPILCAQITEQLVETARAQNIPHQHEVMGGPTGTNVDQIAATRAGVPTGLLSIPLKYMHTPVEVAAISDIEQTARLIAAFIKDFAGKAGEPV